MASALRLYRLDGTEITSPAGRFPWVVENWTFIPSGELDENGDPIYNGAVNDGIVAFPAPAPLDLGSAISHVRLYLNPLSGSYTHAASSDGILLVNFLTGLIGINQYVVFGAGELTLHIPPP